MVRTMANGSALLPRGGKMEVPTSQHVGTPNMRQQQAGGRTSYGMKRTVLLRRNLPLLPYFWRGRIGRIDEASNSLNAALRLLRILTWMYSCSGALCFAASEL
jgi:hypothetical protein